MSTETAKRSDWQLSLANVLVFVVAAALWFLMATLTNIDWLSKATLFAMVWGMVGSYLAWRRRRFGILVLLILFEILVVAQLLGAVYLQTWKAERHNAKKRWLRTVSSGLSAYYSDWMAFPPPPVDSKLGSSELARYLTLKSKRGPYFLNTSLNPNWIVAKDGTVSVFGATGHALTWVRVGTDKLILIDMGEDGLPGQYAWDGQELLKTPVDANKNGIDDGNDDAALGGSWDGLR